MSKAQRDLTFKPRFKFYYGHDNNFYHFALNYKDAWQKSMFYVEEDQVMREVENGGLNSRVLRTIDRGSLKVPEPQLEHIDTAGLLEKLNIKLDLDVVSGAKSGSLGLEFGKPIGLDQVKSDRKGLLLNAGGHITSMKWLHTPLTNTAATHHYLAVSVIHNPDGISDSISHPELSIYHKKTNSDNKINSAIQLWKYELNQNTLTLERVYLTNDIGSTANLDWVPVHVSGGEVLGVLAGTFTDGNFHLLSVNHQHSHASVVRKTSAQYSLAGFLGTNITTYDFLGDDKVLVGSTDGSVAEFLLPYSVEEDDDVSIPSYISRVGESPVSVVSVAQADDDYTIYINTTGTTCMAYSYRNFVQGRLIPQLRTSIKPSPNHTLKTFVSVQNLDTLTYSTFRNGHDTNLLMKDEFTITASKSSEIIGHPLNISGNAGGDIVIINYPRKLLNGSKVTSKSLTPLKLWKLSVVENSLTLSADYELVSTEVTPQQQVTPPEVVISSLAWNENVVGSSIYTAGTISGLLILERLDTTN